MSPALTTGLMITQMVLNVVMALALLWVNGKTRRIENLESDLKRTAGELVDQKVGQLRGAIEHLTREISSINARLSRGDEAFARANAQDHAQDIRLVTKIDELKDYIRDRCATQDDSQRMAERVRAMEVAVAALPCGTEGGCPRV
jgi:chromosome segregation ATPase